MCLLIEGHFLHTNRGVNCTNRFPQDCNQSGRSTHLKRTRWRASERGPLVSCSAIADARHRSGLKTIFKTYATASLTKTVLGNPLELATQSDAVMMALLRAMAAFSL